MKLCNGQITNTDKAHLYQVLKHSHEGVLTEIQHLSEETDLRNAGTGSDVSKDASELNVTILNNLLLDMVRFRQLLSEEIESESASTFDEMLIKLERKSAEWNAALRFKKKSGIYKNLKQNIMKQNGELQKDVQDAIKWEPLLNAAEIGVTVKDGVVTLSGTVDSFAKKQEAENAVRSVSGVRGIIEKIDVHTGSIKFSDEEIIRDILKAFKWSLDIPHREIKVEAESGWVTLTGEVRHNSQRDKAKTIVHNTAGVLGITNDLIVKSNSEDSIEKEEINKALLRNWSFDNTKVKVGVDGNKVTLHGTVHSLYQKDEAARIAWNAPGVWSVENNLEID